MSHNPNGLVHVTKEELEEQDDEFLEKYGDGNDDIYNYYDDEDHDDDYGLGDVSYDDYYGNDCSYDKIQGRPGTGRRCMRNMGNAKTDHEEQIDLANQRSRDEYDKGVADLKLEFMLEDLHHVKNMEAFRVINNMQNFPENIGEPTIIDRILFLRDETYKLEKSVRHMRFTLLEEIYEDAQLAAFTRFTPRARDDSDASDDGW
jgi:hypothetical protein